MYNEAGAITVTLERVINTVMPDFVLQVELIIVDDCSTDDSAILAERFSTEAANIRVIRLNIIGGKGAAVAAGVDAARGDTILVQDADLELDPADIPALLKEYHEGEKEIVSGTRFRSGRRYRGHAGPAVTVNRLLLLMAVTAVIVWLPQMVYWKEMTGHWLWFSYGSDERFFFGDPAIVKGLFSWRKGLFIYTPLMIFSFAGIIALWIRRSPHALAITTFVPLNIYIIFSWWCWWYGGGFGQRAFIDSYALMAVAAAALLSQSFSAGRRFFSVAVMTAFLLFATLSIFNNIQYYHGAIHWDSMTMEAWVDSFGRVRLSARFNDLLEAPDYEMAKKGADR